MKTCPDCAESIQDAARICKHCRYDFDLQQTRMDPEAPVQMPVTPALSDRPHVSPQLGATVPGSERNSVGLVIGIIIWIFVALPNPSGAVAGLLVSFVLAAVIRGAYVLIRKSKHFWSGWLFAIASVLALLSTMGQLAPAS